MKNNVLWILLGFLASTLNAQVSDWNNGGGNPSRNGLADVYGPDTDSVLWEVASPGIFGMPVYIEGNKLVTMRFYSLENAPAECYDLNTGELLWRKEITGLTGRSLPVGIRDGQVYVVGYKETQHDTLHALDAANGEKSWTCNVTVNPYITASVSFTGNGDLVIERSGGISRIDYQTGEQVWNCPLIGFVGGCMEVSVNNSNNTGYCIEQVGGIAYVAAIDLTSGTKKYNHILNDTHPGGGLQQAPIMVGNDGIIYAHRQGDNITAFSDSGNSLTLLWETEIFGNSPFSHMCMGSDGFIYAPSEGKVVRIDPNTGIIRNSSPIICQNPELFQMRASAAENEVIFVTNGENGLYAFTPDLQEIWSDYIPNVNTSGCALGTGGVMAVAGTNLVRVYTPSIYASIKEKNTKDFLTVFPNPARDYLNIVTDGSFAGGCFVILDGRGSSVLSGQLEGSSCKVYVGSLDAGYYLLRLDDPGARGVEFIKL